MENIAIDLFLTNKNRSDPYHRAYLWVQTGSRLPMKASMPSPASWNIMFRAISTLASS
jgi:hypothetical protein